MRKYYYCFAILLGLVHFAWSEDLKSVGEILNKQQSYFERIRTIQYAVTDSFSTASPENNNNGQPTFVTDYTRNASFAQKGNRFRGTCEAIHGDGSRKIEPTVFAFDGNTYQTMIKDAQSLSVQKQPANSAGMAYGATFPEYVMPFTTWAFSRQDRAEHQNFEVNQWLAQEDAWDHLQANSQIVGTETINGSECAVMRIETPKTAAGKVPGVYSLVYFAKDFDYFPVKRQCFQETDSGPILAIEEEVSGLAWGKNEANEAYVIYEKFLSMKYSEGHVVKHEYLFDKNSFKINAPLPDDMFTISPVTALHYRDKDNPKDHFDLDPVKISTLLKEPSTSIQIEKTTTQAEAAKDMPDAPAIPAKTAGASGSSSRMLAAIVVSAAILVGAAGIVLIRRRAR